MTGMTGMAQTLGALTNGIGYVAYDHNTLEIDQHPAVDVEIIKRLSLSTAPNWQHLPLAIVAFHKDVRNPQVTQATRLHLVVCWPEQYWRQKYGGVWAAAIDDGHRFIPRQTLISGTKHPIFIFGYAVDHSNRASYYVMPKPQRNQLDFALRCVQSEEEFDPTTLRSPFLTLPGIHFFDAWRDYQAPPR